jgi:hypothetical protein
VYRGEQVAAGFEAEAVEHVAGRDALPIGGQDLEERRSSDEDTAWVEPLGQEVASRVFGVAEVEVRDVVDEPTVRFLRDVRIKAAVASLHMEHRNREALRHDRGKARVRVAEHEERVGADVTQYRLHLREHIAECPAERRGIYTEVLIGGA